MMRFMDIATLIRFVGQDAYQKGQAYHTQGRIYQIAVNQNMIRGRVVGSNGNLYRTEISYNGEKFIHATCSCPMGEDCKHIAALGIAGLIELRRQNKPSDAFVNTKKKYTLARQPQKKLQKPRKPVWIQAVDRQLREATHPVHQHELELLMRLTDAPMHAWMRRSKSALHIEFRPRVRDRATQKTSLTLVQWKNFHQQYYDNYPMLHADIDPTAKEFLNALTHALAIETAYKTSGWAHIPGTRAQAVWHIIRDHSTFGVPLLFDDGQHTTPVDISEEPLSFALQLYDEHEGGIALQTVLKRGGHDIKTDVLLVGDPPIFGVCQDQEDGASGQRAAHTMLHPIAGKCHMPKQRNAIRIPGADLSFFQTEYLPRMMTKFPIENKSTRVIVPEHIPPALGIIVAKAGHAAIRVGFSWRYGQTRVSLSDARLVITDNAVPPFLRDRDREKELLGIIKESLRDVEKFWNMRIHGSQDIAISASDPHPPLSSIREETTLSDMPAARFINEILPQWEHHSAIMITRDPDVPSFLRVEETPRIEMTVRERKETEAHDWFDLEMEIVVAKTHVPFREVFVALENNEEYLFLKDGRYVSLKTPEFERLKALIARARHLSDTNRERLSLSHYQAGWWQELKNLGIVVAQAEAWERAIISLEKAGAVDALPPSTSLQATLRPYQHEGYSWLHFLREHNLGGILADDMGLGKTVQSIALIAHVRDEINQRGIQMQANKNAPFLIIAPTSVVENWDTEFERFLPHVRRVVLRRGTRSHLHEKMDQADVVITSYALLHRDYARLKHIMWDTIIIDEASFLKNYKSKAYALVRGLNAGARIGLTGTPMENNLMELWSLFSIVAPGLFPPPEDFRALYQKPIERGEGNEELRLLRSQIRPFFLRRKKEEVERDLPPKTEQILFLRMDKKQRQCYDLHLQRERARVLNLLETGSMREHRFEIFAALMRLRQLCLHPALVDPTYRNIPSVKIDALCQHAKELSESSHKALIFSQFTSFLALARTQFDRRGWKYAYLDGATRKRNNPIRQFKENEETRFFLISLKAGGFGLNLTAADYCILLDPWWNPAVEAQAVDRTHRIGQTNPVMVYRFIVKDTIEEKVLRLQEKKRELFKNVFDEGSVFGSLITEDDVRKMFENT